MFKKLRAQRRYRKHLASKASLLRKIERELGSNVYLDGLYETFPSAPLSRKTDYHFGPYRLRVLTKFGCDDRAIQSLIVRKNDVFLGTLSRRGLHDSSVILPDQAEPGAPGSIALFDALLDALCEINNFDQAARTGACAA